LALDQANLLRSVPTFELLLAIDCFERVIEKLVEHKAMAAVSLAETIRQIVLMFVDSPLQVVGHPDIDYAGFAGDDVDAVAMSFHGWSHQQVPPLRIAIDEANRNAPVGMTEFS
jgi:hypothetical protein